MRFVLRTSVAQAPDVVFPVFGDAAFVESLAPRLMGLHVVRIGLGLGDEIEVRFSGLGPRGPWISKIDSLDRTAAATWFVDRSVVIPWPFRMLQHRHGFVADGTGTTLVDDVTFTTRPGLLGPFVYPVLRLSFGLKSTPMIADRTGCQHHAIAAVRAVGDRQHAVPVGCPRSDPLDRHPALEIRRVQPRRARKNRTAMPTSQATGVTSDAGPPVETVTAQSKIEPGKNGVRAGTMPPTICGASKTARPIAPTAAWLGTNVAAASATAT